MTAILEMFFVRELNKFTRKANLRISRFLKLCSAKLLLRFGSLQISVDKAAIAGAGGIHVHHEAMKELKKKQKQNAFFYHERHDKHEISLIRCANNFRCSDA